MAAKLHLFVQSMCGCADFFRKCWFANLPPIAYFCLIVWDENFIYKIIDNQ
jgi:hypothetical protein